MADIISLAYYFPIVHLKTNTKKDLRRGSRILQENIVLP